MLQVKVGVEDADAAAEAHSSECLADGEVPMSPVTPQESPEAAAGAIISLATKFGGHPRRYHTPLKDTLRRQSTSPRVSLLVQYALWHICLTFLITYITFTFIITRKLSGLAILSQGPITLMV